MNHTELSNLTQPGAESADATCTEPETAAPYGRHPFIALTKGPFTLLDQHGAPRVVDGVYIPAEDLVHWVWFALAEPAPEDLLSDETFLTNVADTLNELGSFAFPTDDDHVKLVPGKPPAVLEVSPGTNDWFEAVAQAGWRETADDDVGFVLPETEYIDATLNNYDSEWLLKSPLYTNQLEEWELDEELIGKVSFEEDAKYSRMFMASAVCYCLDVRLDEVLHEGLVVFYHGSSRSVYHTRTYVSRVVENPTYLDVCMAADAAVQASRDCDHHFLEAVELLGYTSDGIAVFGFHFGS